MELFFLFTLVFLFFYPSHRYCIPSYCCLSLFRKSTVGEDADGVKPKTGSHQKGPPGSTPTMSAVQAHREKEREKDRERAREKEREMEIERELDDSNSDYRVAYLDEESGEIYEGGWNPHTQRRQGQGICLYTDGTLYEGG